MKFGGYLLLLASLAVGVHAYQPQTFELPLPAFNARQLPVSAKVAEDPPERRTFNFDQRPVTLRSVAERAASRQERAATPAPEAAVVPVVAAVTTTAEPVPVAQPHSDDNDAATLVKGKLTSVVPADDKARYTLVRNIQRELRRVGCFAAQADGAWDGTTKRAMGAFMDRVNASLPYHEPDYVLLTLVRNHKAAACGETCPKGQSLSGEGRCMPNAIIAKEQRRSQPASTAVAEAKHPALKTPFKTTVAVADSGRGAAASDGTGSAGKARPPLPGRMAMGAPGSTADSGNAGWWETIVGTPAPSPAKNEQTLDVPVGLTRVPEPRLAQRPAPVAVATAAVEPTSASGQDQASGQDGASVGSAGLEVRPQLTVSPPQQVERPARRAGRKYSARRSAGSRPRYARRWGGRNVHNMFQHPLGRM